MVDEMWNARFKRNSYIFIFSYGLMGMVTGITNNAFFSYLDLVTPNIVKGMGMYVAVSSAIMSLLLLLVPKVGYKKSLITCGVMSAVALSLCVAVHNSAIMSVLYVVNYVGVAMFDLMYPLLLSSYVPNDMQVKMFSRTMYTNLIAQAIITFFGGKWVVAIFSKLMHISYQEASTLSADPSAMGAHELSLYIDSYEKVILIAVAFTIIGTLACFFLKEKTSDYKEQEAKEAAEKKEKDAHAYKSLMRKDIIMWIAYLVIIQMGALIVTPYFPIYLNNFLHIDRGVVSTIISLQTLAMVLGYFCAPWLEKKLGAIGSIGGLLILIVPLLLLMANGTMFGANTAWIIGIILFFRSGIANASMPIQQSLQMRFVDKDLRPAFSSLITIVQAVVAFVIGLFTRYVLFVEPHGYADAYYITSVMYTIGTVLLFVCFFKKYNRALSSEAPEEAVTTAEAETEGACSTTEIKEQEVKAVEAEDTAIVPDKEE